MPCRGPASCKPTCRRRGAAVSGPVRQPQGLSIPSRPPCGRKCLCQDPPERATCRADRSATRNIPCRNRRPTPCRLRRIRRKPSRSSSPTERRHQGLSPPICAASPARAALSEPFSWLRPHPFRLRRVRRFQPCSVCRTRRSSRRRGGRPSIPSIRGSRRCRTTAMRPSICRCGFRGRSPDSP